MSNWIDFLRKYGPIPRNDNMYDEAIQRAVKRHGVEPILFEHPFHESVLQCFESEPYSSVILTGTAGDGKTHLCRQVWEELDGSAEEWGSDSPYVVLATERAQQVHFIRDLSGWVPPLGDSWSQHPEKRKLMLMLAEACKTKASRDVFLIAGNDGQLVEALRRLSEEEEGDAAVIALRSAVEEMLVNDRQSMDGVSLTLFNLSRGNGAELFDRACTAFLSHPGWEECRACAEKQSCPVWLNYCLLETPQVRKRLQMLFELCDESGLHLPIRQVLLLLTNAVLGHPDAKDGVMRAVDAQKIRASGKLAEGCLYSNVFGGNLKERRRSGIIVFDYLSRLQIGSETTNRIDNLLIFGDADDALKAQHQELVANDPFFRHDLEFQRARHEYVEAADEDEEKSEKFLDSLIRYRRAMFFKIPLEKEQEYRLWDLTVFHFAGEFTADVRDVLAEEGTPSPHLLRRLVVGLNRVFTGMLLDSEDRLFLAISGSHSQARVCRVFLDAISVRKSKGELVALRYNRETSKVYLRVQLALDVYEELEVSLVRHEFLCRVAEDGALPASFSRECNEDILAFKSRLISRWEELCVDEEPKQGGYADVRILTSDGGQPKDRTITIRLS
jgi:hypothetical protein